jgi:predicted dehydrogenase
MNPLRIGVIGLGLIAQSVHLQNLHTLRETLLVTHVCDLSPALAAQVAAEGAVPRHSSDAAQVFADPQVDAVLILTPGTHAELSRRALLAGKHVLAEKPLAHTVGEARSLAALAAQRGLVLQVGYMKMYDPLIVRAGAELAGLGTLRVIRVTVLHPADDPQFAHQRYLRYDDAPPGPVRAAADYENARLDEALGGLGEPFRSIYSDVLQGSVVHEASVLRALLGKQPLRITHAQIGAFTPGRRLAEPPQLQVLGTIGDCQLILSWNWLPDYPEYAEEIAVFGSAGRLRLLMPGPYLRDHRSELIVESMHGAERSTDRFQSEHRTGFVHELLAFKRAVDGDPVLSTADGAAWDIEAMQAIVKALA